jgi:hypothetical protein
MEQTGPVVHSLDADFGALDTAGTISGEWRFDDAELPLTDAQADSLMDGEPYFNLHTASIPGGEIREQIRSVGGGDRAVSLQHLAAPPNTPSGGAATLRR